MAVVHPYPLSNRPVSAHAGAARFPTHRAIAAARDYARSRAGLVSFAVRDSRGGYHGFAASRSYASASVVKVMLLAAELDRLRRTGEPLDSTTRGLLSAMITVSDNAAADAIYARVGDEGLIAVAHRAQLRDFTVSGYWANAQLTARDMARLMDRLNVVLTGPDADFAAGLLTAITADQRWGIPEVAPAGWRVRFKGGWRGTERGQLVHQIARLERGRREIALAVLTDGDPTMAYGIETVREIAARLFARWRGPAASTPGG
jgi:beta-lactamase class A